MSVVETAGKPADKLGLVPTLAVLTVLAAVAGGGLGKMLATKPPAAATEASATPATRPPPSDTEVRELPAIVTNLAGTPTTHIRLQVAILYVKKSVENPTLLGARVSDDIMSFLKTISLSQLQGASGLQNLREDLNERAIVRSQGAVREIIIETLATQ